MKPYTHEELMTPSAVHWPIANSGALELMKLVRSIRFLGEKPKECSDCMIRIIGFERMLLKS